MTIRSIEELKLVKRHIDLTGPDGNSWVLLGFAKNYCAALDKDWESVKEKLIAGDYEHLIKTFDEEFGDFVDLYR